ncbi:transcriptional regulator with XRE-family HTH domain [Peribacillus deserti]|uniref:Transcriptional regulator with XRE-family HTH domain n=2 Tax=Peribacillus deserti TaxID=673318 RepID=A0ABS2QMK4_9BACI|nr:helix-turn-helix transcriptional regulator [Peribacillus deserti]MBM7694396.1 transcriptional regulator with XRE-family HTH domain [Peribacillus deserti]
MQPGQILKFLRENRNLTQKALALQIRVGTHVIEQFETGEKVPDIPTLLRLSAVLEVPASELCWQSPSPSIPMVDNEITQLISGMGPQRAILILRKVKELTEEEFDYMMSWLYDDENKINQHL